MTTDNFCFYLQNRLIQTSQTGGQWYNDASPISIPCLMLVRVSVIGISVRWELVLWDSVSLSTTRPSANFDFLSQVLTVLNWMNGSRRNFRGQDKTYKTFLLYLRVIRGPGKTTYKVSATLRYYRNGYIWQAYYASLAYYASP
jgi:hypothetical protein